MDMQNRPNFSSQAGSLIPSFYVCHGGPALHGKKNDFHAHPADQGNLYRIMGFTEARSFFAILEICPILLVYYSCFCDIFCHGGPVPGEIFAFSEEFNHAA